MPATKTALNDKKVTRSYLENYLSSTVIFFPFVSAWVLFSYEILLIHARRLHNHFLSKGSSSWKLRNAPFPSAVSSERGSTLYGHGDFIYATARFPSFSKACAQWWLRQLNYYNTMTLLFEILQAHFAFQVIIMSCHVLKALHDITKVGLL